MPGYSENPKTAGSGIICAIPQAGLCPNKCEGCYFQSGGSYLEPLCENTPNLPHEIAPWEVLRVNDGNDSNNDREYVISSTKFAMNQRFFNTSIPDLRFPAPVVLTVNPGKRLSRNYHKIINPPANLMMVRVLVAAWNLGLVQDAVHFYTKAGVHVTLTPMAYQDVEMIPLVFRGFYIENRRTLNTYHTLRIEHMTALAAGYAHLPDVSLCAPIYGSAVVHGCKDCGICLKMWHRTMTVMGGENPEYELDLRDGVDND
jgi:hypothetical protein